MRKRNPSKAARDRVKDAMKQKEYREGIRNHIEAFRARVRGARKMLRCLCSVRCRKVFLTDIGHRIWPGHAKRIDGLTVHGLRYGGGKGKAW